MRPQVERVMLAARKNQVPGGLTRCGYWGESALVTHSFRRAYHQGVDSGSRQELLRGSRLPVGAAAKWRQAEVGVVAQRSLVAGRDGSTQSVRPEGRPVPAPARLPRGSWVTSSSRPTLPNCCPPCSSKTDAWR